MTNLCIRWERIANEILMHFRAQRKLQGEVSLSDTIETGPEGDALYLSDVVGEDDTMLEELQDKENRRLIRRLVAEVLTEREADIIRRRYGLDGRLPQTQKQVAALYGSSRSYVSRIEKKALGKLEEALRGRILGWKIRQFPLGKNISLESRNEENWKFFNGYLTENTAF